MNKNTNTAIKNGLLKAVSLLTSVLPFSLSAALFIGSDLVVLLLITFVMMIFTFKSDKVKNMTAYSAFLIIMFVSKSFGAAATYVSLAISGIIAISTLLLPNKTKIKSTPVTSGLSLATALTCTILLTTHYFGIGASGSNAKEMIASYLSLGFHPNWRGVLYGTIVMVIMITFPRKFKKLCKTISAPFIAVVITLILNLFLNPSYMVSAINEIGGFSFSTAALLPESNIFDRIPVHSLAVILIVGAWENVKWKEIKKVFSSPVNVLFFVASVIATLYFGYIYGVIFSALLYFIYSFCFKKSLSESNN